jgi:predicted DCC family thiol-disulfide oxidoreductase YuxK
MEKLPKDKKIILFDGVCNLCDRTVQFIIQNDKKDIFRFVPLQSELGVAILKHIGVSREHIDSIILYEPGIAYYFKAEAAFQIVKELNTWHRYLHYFQFLGNFTNSIYDYVAQNRYKWYGKKEFCMIPTPDIKAKFLE